MSWMMKLFIVHFLFILIRFWKFPSIWGSQYEIRLEVYGLLASLIFELSIVSICICTLAPMKSVLCMFHYDLWSIVKCFSRLKQLNDQALLFCVFGLCALCFPFIYLLKYMLQIKRKSKEIYWKFNSLFTIKFSLSDH